MNVPQHDLTERVRKVLAAYAVREVRMFGSLSFLVDEKMVVSARGDGELLVRADPERADELLAVEGARPAEMGTGRKMSRSWISVSDQAVATEEGLAFWVGVALEHAQR